MLLGFKFFKLYFVWGYEIFVSLYSHTVSVTWSALKLKEARFFYNDHKDFFKDKICLKSV